MLFRPNPTKKSYVQAYHTSSVEAYTSIFTHLASLKFSAKNATLAPVINVAPSYQDRNSEGGIRTHDLMIIGLCLIAWL